MLLLAALVRAAPASEPSSSEVVDPADDIFVIMEEDKEILTGSARATKLREAPSSVWVIDSYTLRNTAAESLYDVLRTIPGMIVREYSLGNPNVSSRFIGSIPDVQTLVLVDGRIVSSDAIGLYDKQLLNLRDIERVEVVSGPASTLYGPNAFSGVMSITRRQPPRIGDRLILRGEGGVVSGALNAPGSAYHAAPIGQAYAAYGHGWGSGGVQVSVGAQYLPSFGYHTDSDHYLTLPALRLSGLIDLVQDLNGWTLRLQMEGAYKRSTFEIADGAEVEQQDYSSTFTVSKRGLVRDDELTIIASARHYRMLYTPYPAVPIETIPFNSTNAEARVLYSLPRFYNNAMAIGAQVRGSVNDSSSFLPIGRALLQAGIFAEDTYRPIPQLVLTAGLRGDLRESLQDPKPFQYLSFSPRASVVWLINDNHSLRFEYAAAFRSPSAVERAANFIASDEQIFFVGNPNLKNEGVHSFSVGWMGRFGWFTTRLEPYVSYATDIVTPNFIGYDDPATEYLGQPIYSPSQGGRFKLPFYLTNMAPVWIPGAVLRLEAKPTESWRVFFNYTFVPIDIMHIAGIGVDYNWNQRLFASTQIYIHDQAQDFALRPADLAGRVIVNARVSYFLDAKKRWQVSLSGQNLIDVRFFVFRTPGKAAFRSDDYTGEALGPRGMLALEYSMDVDAR